MADAVDTTVEEEQFRVELWGMDPERAEQEDGEPFATVTFTSLAEAQAAFSDPFKSAFEEKDEQYTHTVCIIGETFEASKRNPSWKPAAVEPDEDQLKELARLRREEP